MYTDLPRITRCCFCMPLRYGLLAWAYIKLMFCLFVAFVIVMRNVETQSRSVYTTESIVEALVGFAFLIEISITVVFIVGAHTKKPKLLTVYYRYTIVMVTLTLILYLMGIGADVYGWVMSGVTSVLHIHEFIEMAIVVVGCFLLNLYQLALIKNENENWRTTPNLALLTTEQTQNALYNALKRNQIMSEYEIEGVDYVTLDPKLRTVVIYHYNK